MPVYRGIVFDCRHRPIELPLGLAASLAAAYREPHRAYHDGNHIAEVLGWFDRVADDIGWRQPVEVYLAIVFHDAIYQPGATDNEARSAAWARDTGLGEVDRIAQLIELTARHGELAPADVDPEAALFLDCDMAILGAAPAAFAAYDAAIAIEYGHVPREAFRRRAPRVPRRPGRARRGSSCPTTSTRGSTRAHARTSPTRQRSVRTTNTAAASASTMPPSPSHSSEPDPDEPASTAAIAGAAAGAPAGIGRAGAACVAVAAVVGAGPSVHDVVSIIVPSARIAGDLDAIAGHA